MKKIIFSLLTVLILSACATKPYNVKNMQNPELASAKKIAVLDVVYSPVEVPFLPIMDSMYFRNRIKKIADELPKINAEYAQETAQKFASQIELISGKETQAVVYTIKSLEKQTDIKKDTQPTINEIKSIAAEHKADVIIAPVAILKTDEIELYGNAATIIMEMYINLFDSNGKNLGKVSFINESIKWDGENLDQYKFILSQIKPAEVFFEDYFQKK